MNNNKMNKNMKKEEIERICKMYNIQEYIINVDMSIDVIGDVDLSDKNLSVLPLNFKYVSGAFECTGNKLISLQGCPSYLGSDFNCSSNNLTSLQGSPNYVGGSFVTVKNELTSLVGCPTYVGGDFYCNDNDLISVEGHPRYLNGDIYFNFDDIQMVYSIL
jgi:hypothetical protein